MNRQNNLFDENADYYNSTVNLSDIDNLSFKVHASLIYKLGESLIADEITALSELIKNSYDADASFCSLNINTNHMDENGLIGKIEIKDNGIGMNLHTIVNGWLTISNSPKKKMKKENLTTSKFNRIPLGEKGLGRLSVQKLGSKVTLVTKEKEDCFETEITIPWAEFQKNTTLDKINIDCKQKEVINNKSYTNIIITGLINPAFWTSEEVKKDLEKTINHIISPFRFHDNTFTISATIDDFKVDINNSIFNDILKTARSKYVFKITKTHVELKCKYKIDFFKKRNIYKDYDWFDFNADYFKEMYLKLNSDKENIQYKDEDYIYEISNKIPLDAISSLKRNADGELFYQGDFDGTIYDFSYDSSYVSGIMERYDFIYALKEHEYKDYIKINKGVKVIRDGFVVQGYGEGSVDWLNISAEATTKGKYGDLKNENLIGYIKLTGKNNQSLKETTSREGFINDEYYYNFYTLLRDILIKKINDSNLSLNNHFKKYLQSLSISREPELELPVENVKNIVQRAKKTSSEVQAYFAIEEERINKKKILAERKKESIALIADTEAYKELEDVIRLQNKLISEIQQKYSILMTEIESVKKSAVAIENDFSKFNQRISDVFELAGLGISVELFTHELYSTINNVNHKVKKISNLNSEMSYISNAMNTLRKQISYFYPGLKFVRMKKEVFSLTELLNTHKEFYKQQASAKNIKFIIDDLSQSVTIYAHRGLLNQVLDNLFSNAVYWLTYSRDKMKLIETCEYNITIHQDYSIEIWDNGIGISKDIENDLFNPFVSYKKNGRGLGLFICKQNLENNNGHIRLLRNRNLFENLYKFRIDLSNMKHKEVNDG